MYTPPAAVPAPGRVVHTAPQRKALSAAAGRLSHLFRDRVTAGFVDLWRKAVMVLRTGRTEGQRAVTARLARDGAVARGWRVGQSGAPLSLARHSHRLWRSSISSECPALHTYCHRAVTGLFTLRTGLVKPAQGRWNH